MENMNQALINMNQQKLTLEEEYEVIKELRKQNNKKCKKTNSKAEYFDARDTLDKRKKLVKTTILVSIITFFVFAIGFYAFQFYVVGTTPVDVRGCFFSGLFVAGLAFIFIPGAPYIKWVQDIPPELHFATFGISLLICTVISIFILLFGIPLLILDFIYLNIKISVMKNRIESENNI